MLATRTPYSRLTAFAKCGESHWVLRSRTDPSVFKLALNTCKDRFCQPCSAARAALIRRNLHDHWDDKPKRFATFTIAHDHEPLRVLLERLYRAFRKLRQRTLWKERVDGGIAFLEVKISERSGWWHPHLHCILSGKYIPLPDIRREWQAVTGDSWNVDLRLVRHETELQHYVTKYVTKAVPAEGIDQPELLDELIDALRSRRMVITFGRFRRWKLLSDPSEASWELFGHEDEVRWKASCDDPLASAILAMLGHADPRSGEFTVDLDQLPQPDW